MARSQLGEVQICMIHKPCPKFWITSVCHHAPATNLSRTNTRECPFNDKGGSGKGETHFEMQEPLGALGRHLLIVGGEVSTGQMNPPPFGQRLNPTQFKFGPRWK